MLSLSDARIAIIGLGYVGLPLALAFGKRYPTLGFDISPSRIEDLRRGVDRTLEASDAELTEARHLTFAADPEALRDSNFYVVTVPTPIDMHKRPVLTPLESASETIGRYLKGGDIVVYESTVYPGATEEVCVPILERISGLKFNVDFFVGYSPERINPGDREHRLQTIVKVTAGSTPDAAALVDAVYSSIITAGTCPVSSIAVAEAAKVIENTQRDVNIALVNELALIFDRLGIDTEEVLRAAGTKWNFLKFRPGLVGGHCIGVDPYYLTHKAESIGYHPEMILAGRRLNDGMGSYVTSRVVKLMTKRRMHVAGARILLLGLTFKENCPDLRNTRVIDIVREFESYDATVDIYDPWVDREAAHEEYGVDVIERPVPGTYDAIVVAVAHDSFGELGPDGIRAFGKPSAILFDVKYLLPASTVDGRL